MGAVRAVAFDFNGTLSDDERILYAVYRELFAQHGHPLAEEDYFGTLAGLSEEAIIRSWLSVDGDELAALVEERVVRYLALAGQGETIAPRVRDAVDYAAARVPVAVVSGAFRREIDPVLAGAGLDRVVSVVVAADDVAHGKPDPAGYLMALDRFGGGLRADEVAAVEDTEAGVAAAKAAGFRTIAVLGTHAPERLRNADEIVETVDVDLVQKLIG